MALFFNMSIFGSLYFFCSFVCLGGGGGGGGGGGCRWVAPGKETSAVVHTIAWSACSFKCCM